jgi:hypothetical protein
MAENEIDKQIVNKSGFFQTNSEGYLLLLVPYSHKEKILVSRSGSAVELWNHPEQIRVLLEEAITERSISEYSS